MELIIDLNEIQMHEFQWNSKLLISIVFTTKILCFKFLYFNRIFHYIFKLHSKI